MFYSKVDDFFNWIFKDLNGKFDYRILVTLLIGILLGVIISISFYGILLLISLKNTEKMHKTNIVESTLTDNELLNLVKQIKQDFIDTTSTFTPSEKLTVLGTTVLNTVKSIAGTFYPNSKYPLFELNTEELIMLARYISDRIEVVFDKKMLKHFKYMSISQVLNMLDNYKRVQENKAVKTIKKTTPFRNTFFSILNYANPVYWFKKLIINGTINSALTKMCLIVIDIASSETIKVYSKRVFNREVDILDEDINKVLNEMEEL